MARPCKAVDPEQVRKIARLGCTQEEIADFFGISPRTLRRRFRPVLTRARAEAKMSLRRAMYIRAIRDRSDKMLVWLGRVELGQSVSADGDTLEDVLKDVLATARAASPATGP
jgi:hypothetical protein